MNINYLKMATWNSIQLLLCMFGLFTKGIVDIIFFILWLIAFVITIEYMVKSIKEDKLKPKTITQLNKKTLVDVCLTLMHVDSIKTKEINRLEAKINEAISLIKHTPILKSRDVLEILEREEDEPR